MHVVRQFAKIKLFHLSWVFWNSSKTKSTQRAACSEVCQIACFYFCDIFCWMFDHFCAKKALIIEIYWTLNGDIYPVFSRAGISNSGDKSRLINKNKTHNKDTSSWNMLMWKMKMIYDTDSEGLVFLKCFYIIHSALMVLTNPFKNKRIICCYQSPTVNTMFVLAE